MNFKKALFPYLNYIKFKLLGKKVIMLGVASGFGDYLWSRNLMYWIRKDIKYKNYAIVLITTRRWSDFVNHEDKNIFDIEISIKDPAKVSRSMKNFLHLFHVDTYVQIQHWKDINDNIVTKKYLKRPEYPPKTFIYKYILDYFSKQRKFSSQIECRCQTVRLCLSFSSYCYPPFKNLICVLVPSQMMYIEKFE